MKNLMRILSLVVLICGVVVTGTTIYLLIKKSVSPNDYDLIEFYGKILALCILNIMPIISIALCCYCLERNDENYFTRIIPFYMLIPIVITSLLTFFDFGEDINGFLTKVYGFFESTYLCITILSLLFIVKPNNQITRIIKLSSYGVIALNVIMSIIIKIKSYMVETLPNVYEYDGYGGGFNFSSVAQTQTLSSEIYTVSLIAGVFLIILLFITNYAFSEKIQFDVDEIDYSAVKKEAEEYNKLQMQKMYNKEVPKEETNITTPSNGNGNLMNIDNQLGVDSNVGKVQEKAKTVKIAGDPIELMPVSNGPVINETISKTNTNVNPQQPAVQKIEQPQVQVQQTAPVQQQVQPPQVQQIQQPQVQVQQTAPVQQQVQPPQVQQIQQPQVQVQQAAPVQQQVQQIQPPQVQQSQVQQPTQQAVQYPKMP